MLLKPENKESEYYDEEAKKQYFDKDGNNTTQEYKLSDIIFRRKRKSSVLNYLKLTEKQQEKLKETINIWTEKAQKVLQKN